MKTLQQQRLEFLQDTVNYYSEDTSRRAISREEYCSYYVPETGNKCAIGRFIPSEMYSIALEGKAVICSSGIGIVFSLLPKEIKDLGSEFLQAIQDFHDRKAYWNESGLTDKGDKCKQHIINTYCK